MKTAQRSVFDSGRLAAVLALLLAGPALAETAGHVSFVSGPVTVTSFDGSTHSLHKGDPVEGGDRLNTGNGRVQIRFSDGGFVALQPDTVFRVEHYVYASKKPGDSSLLFDLMQGGMRTITGVIGHVNRASYRLKTGVADIGVRGTEYLAEYDGNALHVAVGLGSVEVSNARGSLTLVSGQSALVLPLHAPRQALEAPEINAPSPSGATNQIGAAYLPVDVRYSTVEQGIAYTSTYVEQTSFNDVEVKTGASNISDASGLLSSINGDGIILQRDGSAVDTGAELDQGSDGNSNTPATLQWGRWVSGSPTIDGQQTSALSTVDSVHYVTGSLTPASTMSALNAQGGSATYRPEGATAPTNGSNAGKLNTGSLVVSFGAQPTMLVDLDLSVGTLGYSVSADIALNSGSATFATALGTSANTTGTKGGACNGNGGCNAYASGFFAGAQGNKVGLSYAINDNGNGTTVRGAAAFGR